jgi:hypothetical protein
VPQKAELKMGAIRAQAGLTEGYRKTRIAEVVSRGTAQRRPGRRRQRKEHSRARPVGRPGRVRVPGVKPSQFGGCQGALATQIGIMEVPRV